MTRIVVTEDDILLGELVGGLLRDALFEIVATAATGAEAVLEVKRHEPAILLLDVNLPDGDGWDVLRELRRSCPHVRTVMMSVDYNRDVVRKARRLGAVEYVDKRRAPSSLSEVLGRVSEGDAWFQDHESALRGVEARERRAGRASLPRPLTEREQQVAQLVCEGKSNSEIAEALSIARSTATAHVGNILVKLDADNRTNLARIVVERGLLPRRRGTD